MAPGAKSQGGELEQQPKLRDDLLCYVTAVPASIHYLLCSRRGAGVKGPAWLLPRPQLQGHKEIREAVCPTPHRLNAN